MDGEWSGEGWAAPSLTLALAVGRFAIELHLKSRAYTHFISLNIALPARILQADPRVFGRQAKCGEAGSRVSVEADLSRERGLVVEKLHHATRVVHRGVLPRCRVPVSDGRELMMPVPILQNIGRADVVGRVADPWQANESHLCDRRRDRVHEHIHVGGGV